MEYQFNSFNNTGDGHLYYIEYGCDSNYSSTTIDENTSSYDAGEFQLDDNSTLLDYVVDGAELYTQEEIQQPEQEQQQQIQVSNSPKVAKTPISRLSSVSKRVIPWSLEEDRLIGEIVASKGSKNWVQIASLFPGRTGTQIRSRYHQYIKNTLYFDNKKPNDRWTPSEDDKLLELVKESGKKKDWLNVSELLGTKTKVQCSNRYRYLNPNKQRTSRKRWSVDEDKELLSLVNQYNGRSLDWGAISNKMSTQRCKTQCCNRYNGYLKESVMNKSRLELTSTSTSESISTSEYITTYPTVTNSNSNSNSSLITNEPILNTQNHIKVEEEEKENGRIYLLNTIQTQIESYNTLSSVDVFLNIQLLQLPNKISLSFTSIN